LRIASLPDRASAEPTACRTPVQRKPELCGPSSHSFSVGWGGDHTLVNFPWVPDGHSDPTGTPLPMGQPLAEVAATGNP
jgi:hypothetical protein